MANVIKPPTRDQLAKFLPTQELIRKFEQLFDEGGVLTPEQIEILLALAQEIAIEANMAAARANEALDSIEGIVARLGLLPQPEPVEVPDDLAPPIQIGTLAFQNDDSVQVGNLQVDGVLTFGAYTADVVPLYTGYVEVTDLSGNVRKLMVAT